MAPSSSESAYSTPVYLHVYDILPQGFNKTNYIFSGKSIFHAAVEVYSREWNYGSGDGIAWVQPGSEEAYAAHRDPIPMGFTDLSEEQVLAVLTRMEKEWDGDDYNLLSKNCCTFARAFLDELGAEPMPGWVDRAARRSVESLASTGVQAAGVGGMRVMATRAAATTVFEGAAGPAGWAAWGGELIGGHVGGLLGENVGGDKGKQVGQNVGGIGGSVGAGAAVGAAFAGPAGAGIGAGIGCASYALGKAATWVVKKADPNKCMTTCTVAAFQSSS